MPSPHAAIANESDTGLPAIGVARIGPRHEARFALELAAIAAPDAKRPDASKSDGQYLQQISTLAANTGA